MATLQVEELDAWRRMPGGTTYSRPDGVVKITHGKNVRIVVPFGHGYECEGGHTVEVYELERFLRFYSWTPITAGGVG